MLLIFFFMVEIEHMFVLSKIMLHTGKKSPIAFSKSTLKTSLKHLIQNCHFMDGNSYRDRK